MQYDALPLLGDVNEAGAMEMIRGYHAATRYVDAQLGLVLNAIESAGIADETIILVAGDHGFLLGEQRMWTKHALFEPALRTPLIVVDPARAGNQTVTAVTDLLDVYPTLAELAGLPTPQLDGASLLPLLTTPTLSEHPDKPVSISRWLDGESVRDARYRYSVWFDAEGAVVEQMLFDLEQDPHETRNVAGLAENEQTVARLMTVLEAHRGEGEWSPKLAALVERMAFTSSPWGPLVLAMRARPVMSMLIGAVIVANLLAIWLLYRRQRRLNPKPTDSAVNSAAD